MELSQSDFINSRSRFIPEIRSIEPKIDHEVSKIVGRKVLAQDPKLIRLIIKWKAGKPQDSIVPDNFLKDPEKIKELKDVFKQSL